MIPLLVSFQTSMIFHVNMFQAQNKNFTLVDHVIYCVPVLSSKLIEIIFYVLNPYSCLKFLSNKN